MHDLELPIMTSILPSNELQVAKGLQLIMENGDTNESEFWVLVSKRERTICEKAR